MIDKILRFYSFVFVGVLALFFVAVSLLALLAGKHNLQFDMLPWEGVRLTYWLLGLGLLSLVSIGLAWKGVLRVLFALVSIFVLVMMVKGFFFSAYWFRDPGQFKWAILLCVGALGAAIGGLVQWRKS